jgi:glutathione S-transferase
MGLRIYGMARSRAFRALWVAEELGIPYEHIKTDLSEAGTRAPEFRAINPNGRIPVLDDDGFKIWESMAITLYLAKKHADKGLYPKSLQDEAKLWQWALWATTEVEGSINLWGMHAIALAPEKRDPKQAEGALKKLQTPLAVLDAHLKAQPHLVGNAFTVADLNTAAVLVRGLQMDLTAMPSLDAWLHRCYDRPAAQRAMKLREQR